MRSPIFLVSRVGSRSLRHIGLSKTGFDLILSNSNADSRGLKHELLLVSAVAGGDRPALHLVRELDKQHLEVCWVLTTFGGFFSGWFFSVYHINCSGLLIAEFGLCPDGPFLQLWSALRAQLSRFCLSFKLLVCVESHLMPVRFAQPPSLLRKGKAIYMKKHTASSAGLCLDLCGVALNH